MGAIYSARGSYGLGLLLLALVTLAVLVLTATVVRSGMRAGPGREPATR